MVKIADKPLISVIIPTYNRADLIERAIASVIQQSYENLEIIVVDDASQDNTAEVVSRFCDRRVRYVCHQTNQGGSEARNTGINRSEGQYIAFLDSDDIWLPHKIEYQLAAIVSQHNPENENIVSYTRFQKSSQVFYQRSILPQRGKTETETIADYFWLGGGEMLTSTLLVSRSLAATTLFESRLPKHQDLDFVIRLEQNRAEFVFVNQVLAVWHNESRRDRISKQTNYQLSLDWIQKYREQISNRAFQGFLLKEVVPKMLLNEDKKVEAFPLILNAFRERVISISYLLFLMSKLAIPRQYQQKFKILIKKASLIN
jgi:glycosyltransferase involved in cell wall biosynthesis